MAAEIPTLRDAPARFVQQAIAASTCSPCRSKRGVAIFSSQTSIATGYNYKPSAFACNGSATCKATCRIEAVHAEQAALLLAGRNAEGADLIHVKTVDGALVVSGGPSCVQCSKLILVAGIQSVWLYEAHGWQQYTAEDFHRRSLAAADPPRVGERPQLTDEGDGDIGLDWDRGSRAVVSLSLGRDHLGYAALIGQESLSGRVQFSAPLPEAILAFLRPPRVGEGRQEEPIASGAHHYRHVRIEDVASPIQRFSAEEMEQMAWDFRALRKLTAMLRYAASLQREKDRA